MNNLSKNINAFILFSCLKFKKMFSFKVNVISQTVGMFINNLAFLFIWWLLYKRFGNINGYSFRETFLIEGFVALFYAFFFLFIGGITKLSEYVNQDKILDLQLYPVNPLTILITKSGAPSQFGDFLQGTLMIVIYLFLNSKRWGWIFASVILATIGLFGVSLIFNSLIFFFPKVLHGFSNIIENIYIGGSMYPSQNFRGVFRYILYAVLLIPIISFPVEVLRGFLHPSFLIYTIIAVIMANVLGYFLWNKGIKRFESGSGGGIVE
ncbi:ABC transporter permease [Patescibacteria group bacterium]|nr:ABC transporter permease [Patescibacteria group bacterium]